MVAHRESKENQRFDEDTGNGCSGGCWKYGAVPNRKIAEKDFFGINNYAILREEGEKRR